MKILLFLATIFSVFACSQGKNQEQPTYKIKTDLGLNVDHKFDSTMNLLLQAYPHENVFQPVDLGQYHRAFTLTKRIYLPNYYNLTLEI